MTLLKKDSIVERLDLSLNPKKAITENLQSIFKNKRLIVEGKKQFDLSAYFEKGINLPEQGSLEESTPVLEMIKEALAEDLKKSFEGTVFSWGGATNAINTCDIAGSEVVITETMVTSSHNNLADKKQLDYFIFLPVTFGDNRTYANCVFFTTKSGVLAHAIDALNEPENFYYYVFSLRKHNERNSTGDTVIQECMQGLAIDIVRENPSLGIEALAEEIRKRIKANGFGSILLSGGSVSVTEFDETKMEIYVMPAARTGLAFSKFFGRVNGKVYHPSIKGSPFEAILAMGRPYLNKLPKDCWNPADLLVTDMAAEDIKEVFSECGSLAGFNAQMKLWMDKRERHLPNGKTCFIPLSLKLNISGDRDSVVETLNTESLATDYKVYNHFVRTNGVGNEIDIFANISGLTYKFYIRCNGTSSAVIEGQHTDAEYYYKTTDKLIDSESGDLVDTDEVDIEAYVTAAKTNTDSFLGKSKSILFSVMDPKEFKKSKATVNFDPENRANFREGSLPWRLVDMANKIVAMPAGAIDDKGNQKGHDPKKAALVAELARDLASLIVLQKWNTEQALIYMLTASQKENYGEFNKFAPYYKIS